MRTRTEAIISLLKKHPGYPKIVINGDYIKFYNDKGYIEIDCYFGINTTKDKPTVKRKLYNQVIKETKKAIGREALGGKL
jgi:hypothetical protein